MTRQRLEYAVLLLAAFLFQLYSENYLAGFFWALALCLPVLGFLLSLPAMLACRVRLAADCARVRRGDEAHWRVEVSNRRRLPLAQIWIRLRTENRLTGASRLVKWKLTGASQGVYVPEPADTSHCGCLEGAVVRVRVCDCLGLVSFRLRAPAPAVIAVLPVSDGTAPPPELKGARRETGALRPRPGGGPGEDYDLRPYRPGDPVRMIHWKLSSKREEVVVREVLEAPQAVPVLLVDHFGEPERLDETLDRLCAVSQTLLEWQRAHWVRWSGADGEARARYVSCRREWDDCLTALLSDPAGSDAPLDAQAGEAAPHGGELWLHIGAEQEAVS